MKKYWKVITAEWVLLTSAILFVDFIGVRLIDFNGLVFQVLCYWYGIGYFIAATVFGITICFKNLSYASIMNSLAMAGLWWLFVFFLLMWFHGFIGGWY